MFGVWGGFGTVTAYRFFTDVNELIWIAETEFAKGGDGGTEARLCAHNSPEQRDDAVVFDDWPAARAAKAPSLISRKRSRNWHEEFRALGTCCATKVKLKTQHA
ncbi:hypothetical protein AMAG_19071 [Allomyces macrogynus ATCC 38327]|uniref:Uncharacterized protein n=1 Tax=Allomyces macrogynus (strain ATCC 38327) TaxID=578462 RepID=A0A0L0SMX0_ALLM3|nr:hypothetical protein AMAG_19071 [Allomyces macrogynus ATCC 38327]|eukprot:KNE63838.1 hypothetical protein AMAG_19071 [Allomyces macrogynus ATCC 38327]